MSTAVLFSNNAQTTLAGAITNITTTANLQAGAGALFPAPTGTDYFVGTFVDAATGLINEIVHVTNVTGDVITMVRAQEGTTAKAWSAGDIFANFCTKGTMEVFRQGGVPVDLTADAGQVTGVLPLPNLPASNTSGGGLAVMKLNAGDPNGVVAGNASVNGASDFCYDTTNKLLYICTTTGTASTAVWTADVQPLVAGGAVSGLSIINNATTPDTQVDVSMAAVCMVDSAGLPQFASAPSFTINVATNGVNGFDTGSPAAGSWVYIFAIGNGTLCRGLASASSTSPTLPSGYTKKKYLGAMRYDASSKLMRTKQLGREAQYVVTPTTNTAAMPIVISGNQGAPGTPTWVAASVASVVPSTAGEIDAGAFVNLNSVTIAAPNSNYGAYTTTTNPPPLLINNAETVGSNIIFKRMVLESANISVAIGGANNAVFCAGWTDYFV